MATQPMRIVFGGGKGGCGKSTLAIHTAGELCSRGLQTLLADADPQGTTMTWANVMTERNHHGPDVVALGDNLRATLPNVDDAYDASVIDCAGRIGKRFTAAAMIADLVLLPALPSPNDLWAMAETLQLLDNVREIRPGLAVRFVLNGAQAGQLTTQAARHELQRDTGVELLSTSIALRADYRKALAMGLTASTYAAGGMAALDIRNLVDEILEVIGAARAAA